MTKSKSVSASNSKETSQNSQFVNYDLTEQDKLALKKLAPTGEQLAQTLALLVKEGYTVSISWDNYSDCVQCFLIAKAPSLANHGYILTSRANSVMKALAALIYKHTSVFEGVWHDRVVGSRPSDDF